MQPIVIALLGAGSRSFGPETVRDVLLSETLGPRRVELRLMDIVADNLSDIGRYTKSLVEKLGRNAEVSTTTALETALERAQFVVRGRGRTQPLLGARRPYSAQIRFPPGLCREWR